MLKEIEEDWARCLVCKLPTDEETHPCPGPDHKIVPNFGDPIGPTIQFDEQLYFQYNLNRGGFMDNHWTFLIVLFFILIFAGLWK